MPLVLSKSGTRCAAKFEMPRYRTAKNIQCHAYLQEMNKAADDSDGGGNMLVWLSISINQCGPRSVLPRASQKPEKPEAREGSGKK